MRRAKRSARQEGSGVEHRHQAVSDDVLGGVFEIATEQVAQPRLRPFRHAREKVRGGVQLEVFGLHSGDCDLVAKLDCRSEIEGFVSLALKARDMKAQRLQRDFFGSWSSMWVSPLSARRVWPRHTACPVANRG